MGDATGVVSRDFGGLTLFEPKLNRQYSFWRMASSGMLRRVALARTDVSEEPSAPFIRETRIGELRTTLAVTSNRRTLRLGRLLVTASVVHSSPILVTLMKKALSSFEMPVLTRAKRSNIPEDTILHRHRRGYLKSYKNLSIRVVYVRTRMWVYDVSMYVQMCASLQPEHLDELSYVTIFETSSIVDWWPTNTNIAPLPPTK
jgi:hypothetical protein